MLCGFLTLSVHTWHMCFPMVCGSFQSTCVSPPPESNRFIREESAESARSMAPSEMASEVYLLPQTIRSYLDACKTDGRNSFIQRGGCSLGCCIPLKSLALVWRNSSTVHIRSGNMVAAVVDGIFWWFYREPNGKTTVLRGPRGPIYHAPA